MAWGLPLESMHHEEAGMADSNARQYRHNRLVGAIDPCARGSGMGTQREVRRVSMSTTARHGQRRGDLRPHTSHFTCMSIRQLRGRCDLIVPVLGDRKAMQTMDEVTRGTGSREVHGERGGRDGTRPHEGDVHGGGGDGGARVE